jgi:preprotein translocase subunit SecY
LTIVITLVQGPTYIYNLYRTLPSSAFLLGFNSFEFLFSSVIILVTGTIFAMWLGEKITDKGIGNGISLLIMVGILARFPQAFIQEFTTRVTNNNGGPMLLVIEIIIWLLVIVACVLLTMAIRKIPVQYARRTTSGDFEQDMMGGNRQWIPLKLNASGVMPIIFASSLLLFPQFLAGFLQNSSSLRLQAVSQGLTTFLQSTVLYSIVYFLLVVFFTYFYTAVTFDPKQIATNLQKNGAFIPGIRPGDATNNHIAMIVTRITLVGSVFLGIVAVLPLIVQTTTGITAFAIGGTSLLIVVSVVIDLVRRVSAQVSMQEY